MFETIFEIMATVLFIWLSFKVLKLTLKITWGFAKILAVILLFVSLPALIVCLVFTGGAVLLLPLVLVGAAFGLVKCASV